ncbi:3-hydroxy-3-methylglutaryl-coenzyme A (HMG-CoA) reductase isozyme, partial [Spiromyces aspiralis]
FVVKQVVRGVNKCKYVILRDYMFEIGVLMTGALTNLRGLREFSIISVLLLTFDCIFLFSFYTAVLTLKLDIIRLRSQSQPQAQALTNNSIPSSKGSNHQRSLGSTERASSATASSVIGELAQKSWAMRSLKMLIVFGYAMFHLADIGTPMRNTIFEGKYSSNIFAPLPSGSAKVAETGPLQVLSTGSSNLDSFVLPLLHRTVSNIVTVVPYRVDLAVPVKYIIKSAEDT